MSIRALAAATVAAAAVVAIPAMSTAAPVAAPAIIITPRPTITFRPPPPDLTIGRAGGCTWYRGADGDVWINPLIEAYGTGLFLPAYTSFDMVSNWDKHTAGGSLVLNAAQTWAIDIGPAGPVFVN